MRKTILPTLIASSVILGSLCAQETERSGDRFTVPGTDALVKTWSEGGVERSAVSRDGGGIWIQLAAHDYTVTIRERVFDPLTGDATLSPMLMSQNDNELFLVQFHTDIIPEYHQALTRMGAEIAYYVPNQSYLVRMSRGMVSQTQDQAFVRAVADFHTGLRLDSDVLASVVSGVEETSRYNVIVVNHDTDVPATVAAIQQLGGTVHMSAPGDLLIEATLSSGQLMQLMQENTVMWIERYGEPGVDIDLARIQAGSNYTENQMGDDFGKGMRGHIFEGVHRTHTEFAARSMGGTQFRAAPISLLNSNPDSHGTQTAGEVYARGNSPLYKGMLPWAQMIYTNYVGVNRLNMTRTLINPSQQYKAMLSTASWGGGRTRQYTGTSSQTDLILFQNNLFSTQSQSNAGTQDSRPQAWAKNMAGIGGFLHRNNTNPNDDCHCGTGSKGPAADGRVGVTFHGYYEGIRTTNLSSGYTTGFGGTSGATPMVNGLCGQAMQLFGDGLFGYPQVPMTPQGVPDRFGFRPGLTTVRVLVSLGTRQNAISRSDRYEQGWGFPNTQTLYDNRDNLLILDEEDVLRQGQARTYYTWVRPGTPQYRASMHHLEPQAAAFANPTRTNSLDLQVVAPDGNAYWGNDQGLLSGPWSTPGGNRNDRDVHENVILNNPVGGVYTVTVRATAIRTDAHVATPQMDASFALGVFGIGGGRDKSAMVLDLKSDNPGEFAVSLTNIPSGWAAGNTLLSVNTSRHLSLGNYFGMELDSLSFALLGTPHSQGGVFAFLPTAAPQLFPNADFDFPAPLAQALSGITFDAVSWVVDGNGVLEVSNVDRVTVQ